MPDHVLRGFVQALGTMALGARNGADRYQSGYLSPIYIVDTASAVFAAILIILLTKNKTIIVPGLSLKWSKTFICMVLESEMLKLER
jgi:hypothetical protein